MDVCWQQPPPLYQTDPDRVAACFLYQNNPVLPTTDVAEAFRKADPRGGGLADTTGGMLNGATGS